MLSVARCATRGTLLIWPHIWCTTRGSVAKSFVYNNRGHDNDNACHCHDNDNSMTPSPVAGLTSNEQCHAKCGHDACARHVMQVDVHVASEDAHTPIEGFGSARHDIIVISSTTADFDLK